MPGVGLWPAREIRGLPYEAKIMWERRVEESSRRAGLYVFLERQAEDEHRLLRSIV